MIRCFSLQIFTSGCLGLLISFGSCLANAQTGGATTDQRAQNLLDEASALMAVGNYADACPKIEKVTQMVPNGIGAHEALGECYEKEHKFRSACLAYREAEELAKLKNDPRAKEAGTACDKIEKRTPRVVVKAPENLRNLQEWGIKIDGRQYSIDLDQFNQTHRTVLLTDQGTHLLDISFDKTSAWKHRFLVENGEALVIEVPTLPIFSQMPGRRNVGLALTMIPTSLVTLTGIGIAVYGIAEIENKIAPAAIGIGGAMIVMGGLGILGATLTPPNHSATARYPSPQFQFGIAPNGASLKVTF